MEPTVILCFISALFAGGIALGTAWQGRRSVARWAFIAGMAVLAAENVLAILSADAVLPEDIVYWQRWKFLATSLLPGTWLLFSLTYARGNFREFLTKWRLPLVTAFVLPIGVVMVFGRSLLVSRQHARVAA